jgi:hypothetical protein
MIAPMHRLPRLVRVTAFTLLLSLSLDAFAKSSHTPHAAIDPAQARQAIQKRGIGLGIRVAEVNGTHVRGLITAIQEDTFDVTPAGTTQSTQIPFSDLIAIHNDGPTTKGKVVKGVAIAAGVYVAICVVAAAVVIGIALH